MLFAYDYNDNRVHIDDTHSNQEYYCPYCGEPLITRKGDIRQHHFAHKSNSPCSDSWVSDRTYDLSPWHNEWQSLFPKENQEVKLALGETKHRADVMIDRTVIEFQHSIMSVEAFDNRNNFYFNLGHKVIWLFDISDLWAKGSLSYQTCDDGLLFDWKNPKKAFNSYDVQCGCIDLFFQLNSDSDRCIVRVIEVSEGGFERFMTTELMSKDDFLAYVGLKDGVCRPPCREDEEENRRFCEFKGKYNIELNKQQERALLAVEGSNLLLAVPGSGKTTVLVARLGHMVINKHIPPESILAVTYGKNADAEMRERFSAKFGKSIGARIDFRTINSLSYKIYSDFCRKYGKIRKVLISDRDRRSILGDIFKRINKRSATENDYQELSSAISYIKNYMLPEEQISDIERDDLPLSAIYRSYQETLAKNGQMDYDDQMVFAHSILQKRENIADEWRAKYRYICVDEAQDTSKIQHEIIRILAQGNSLFMVGDEDQSIYGYRAAYPKALLNFRYRYNNPYILRMERNYRSTNQIVDKAQTFISRNKGRYKKYMTSVRGDGDAVQLEQVGSKEEQYLRLLNVAKNAKNEIAFLYRDNESAVVLMDLLQRNGIPFNHREAVMNFFETRVVKDLVAYFSLATNETDADAFDQICNKGIIYLKEKQKDYAIKHCKQRRVSIFDAIEGQMQYLEEKDRGRGRKFRRIMYNVANAESSRAIDILLDAGYRHYLEKNNLSMRKVEIVSILAKQEPNLSRFLERLKELETLMRQNIAHDGCMVTLSTIHSSKGLEYDSVYMVDVYDGRFPSSRVNVFSRSKDNADGEMEERRLFYVGITRAKNHLHLFNIHNSPSSYIEELFPEKKNSQPIKTELKNSHASSNYSTPTVGMKLLHTQYGELSVLEIDQRQNKTIIKVADCNGEISSKTWEVLWDNNLIKIVSD